MNKPQGSHSMNLPRRLGRPIAHTTVAEQPLAAYVGTLSAGGVRRAFCSVAAALNAAGLEHILQDIRRGREALRVLREMLDGDDDDLSQPLADARRLVDGKEVRRG